MRELTGGRLGRWPGTWALGASLSLVAAAAATAQPDSSEAFVREVRFAIANALNDALEHSRSDNPVVWTDPSGRITGPVTVYAPTMQNGRPCRSFKYVLHDAQQEVTDTGLYCRSPAGLWSTAGVPDIVATRLIAPALLSPPADRQAEQALPEAPQPDPVVAGLQRNFVRLAYDDGPVNGLRQAGFENALQQFQLDEGLPLNGDPDALRRALLDSMAVLARSERGGTCDRPPDSQGAILVCGRRR